MKKIFFGIESDPEICAKLINMFFSAWGGKAIIPSVPIKNIVGWVEYMIRQQGLGTYRSNGVCVYVGGWDW